MWAMELQKGRRAAAATAAAAAVARNYLPQGEVSGILFPGVDGDPLPCPIVFEFPAGELAVRREFVHGEVDITINHVGISVVNDLLRIRTSMGQQPCNAVILPKSNVL